MGNRLTPKAEKEIEEILTLRREGIKILEYIVSEWESDPLSVQCFDLRIVERAGIIIKRLKKIDVLF